MLCKTLMKMMRAGVAAAAILFCAAPPVSGQTTPTKVQCPFQFVTFKPPARTTALAYGFINENGTPASGTDNVRSSWNDFREWYEIEIIGESYSLRNFTTVVTPAAPTPACEGVVVDTYSESGYLIVEVWRLSP